MARCTRRKQEKKIYRTVLYVRESKADKELALNNQLCFLRQYIAQHLELEEQEAYRDLGYSGTSFFRPDFCRMIQGIKQGKIDCVVVRDLSRLGRDYKELGRYMEVLFPQYGVRLISLLEEYDSRMEQSRSQYQRMVLQNLMNEMYARDISEKVRAVYRMKQKSAEYLGGKPPYGYGWGACHTLTPCAETAETVQQMFRIAAEGQSAVRKVTDWLNNQKIKTPAQKRGKQWHPESVRFILKNPVYLGILVRKDGSRMQHAHPALVTESLFWEVQWRLSGRQVM